MFLRTVLPRISPIVLGAASSLASFAATAADAPPIGETRFLCCNMQLRDGTISDINYTDGARQVPLGTTVKILDVSRHSVKVEIDGHKVSFDNDYSRALGMPAFIDRYLLKEDPRPGLEALPAPVQAAIKAGQVVPGMTHAQVIQALGYPIVTENPSLDARVWKYWTSGEDESDAIFDADQRVASFKAGGPAPETPCALNVYRPTGSAGGAVRTNMQVIVDGKPVEGALSWGNTVCIDVAAGTHEIALQDKGSGLIGMLAGPSIVAKLNITTVAGTPSYIRYDTRLQSVFLQVPVTTFEESDELRWRKRV